MCSHKNGKFHLKYEHGDGRLTIPLEDTQGHYSTLRETGVVCAYIHCSYVRYKPKENYNKCSNQEVCGCNIVIVAFCKMYRIGVHFYFTTECQVTEHYLQVSMH
jgi:hypothetical protein